MGPEVIAGSTRLKAGTATKMILNMISTGAMVKIGKTLGNRMVDLQPTNEKLRIRSRRILRELAGADENLAAQILERMRRFLETGPGRRAGGNRAWRGPVSIKSPRWSSPGGNQSCWREGIRLTGTLRDDRYDSSALTAVVRHGGLAGGAGLSGAWSRYPAHPMPKPWAWKPLAKRSVGDSRGF